VSRGEYDRLVELGMFEDERIELLRGVLVTMSPQGGPHATIERRLGAGTRHLGVAARGRDRAPERRTPARRGRRVVGAQGSRRQGLDLRGGGCAGVLDRRSDGELVLAVHTHPSEHGYRHVETLRDGDVVRPTRLAGVEIAVAGVPWRR
jgi:hypothetical protein